MHSVDEYARIGVVVGGVVAIVAQQLCFSQTFQIDGLELLQLRAGVCGEVVVQRLHNILQMRFEIVELLAAEHGHTEDVRVVHASDCSEEHVPVRHGLI